MNPQTIATREQWLAARKQLLEREKAHTRQKDALAVERRALPWVKLDTDYMFDAEAGKRSLADLFGTCSQLVVYHFMYGPEWDTGCVSCSFWADSFDGIEAHLKERDIAFVAISRAPLERLMAFRKRLGWSFEWVSSLGNSFNADFHVSFGSDHDRDDPVYYNFQKGLYPLDEAHGTSVFAKSEDGEIFHTYSTYGRGLDAANAAYAYIDLTPNGRNEPPEGNPMTWVRHHDAY